MTTVLRECFAIARQGWRTTGYPVIILGTTCDIEKIPTGVLGAFKEEISIEAPGELERHAILRSLTSGLTIAPDVSLRALAVQTAALVANDLVDLVRRARSAAASRALAILEDTSTITLRDLQCAGLALTAVDFNDALEKARSSYSESIGAPKIPSVTWDDVGGLANVKTDILDTIQLPLEHPELFADGLKKRSGEITWAILFGFDLTGKLCRYSIVWSTWHGQNTAGESGRHFMLAQLLLSQRSRAAQHVHRRVRSECPSCISASTRREALCHLL